MEAQRILDFLGSEGAVLTNSHFIYTSGLHGTAYINMRSVAHHSWWLSAAGRQMGKLIRDEGADLVLGPETLGRTLAGYAALEIRGQRGIWCDIVEDETGKNAKFSPKLGFDRLIPGQRVAIVDDLLTTGSSIKLAAELVKSHDGVPVVGVAVVRRTPDVSADDCGVAVLHVLADVPGFRTFTEAECQEHGPCSRRAPVVLRPGHGHEWVKDHPDYPTA
jgi:orotate phosphoribosyltransferase